MSISAYDQFVCKELDPVDILKPQGINEENKFDPVKLAGVLASLGDFKDKKYRRKIGKDQVMMIHAVRYLLEKSPSEQNPVKRQNQDAEGGTTDAKRRKTGEESPFPELSTASCTLGVTHASELADHNPADSHVSLGLTCLSGEMLNADLEAALILADMSRTFLSKKTSSKGCKCNDIRRARKLRAVSYETKTSCTLKKARMESTKRAERRS